MEQYDSTLTTGYAGSGQKDFFHRRYITYPTWLDCCGDVKGKSVLDVGCGEGRSSRMLATAGAFVVGVDNSPHMLELARQENQEQNRDIRYFQYNVMDLPQFKPSFDLVAGAMIMHYAQNLTELYAYAYNFGRNLAPQKKLVLMNLDPDHPIQQYQPILGYDSIWADEASWRPGARVLIRIFNGDGDPVGQFYNWYWPREQIVNALNFAGFAEIEWTKCRVSTAGREELRQTNSDYSAEELEQMMILSVITATKQS